MGVLHEEAWGPVRCWWEGTLPSSAGEGGTPPPQVSVGLALQVLGRWDPALQVHEEWDPTLPVFRGGTPPKCLVGWDPVPFRTRL